MQLPDLKPNNPNFSSGPCSKRPGWSINDLQNALLGRSHRAGECKKKLKEVRISRLEKQLKSNILKRKKASKKNNG